MFNINETENERDHEKYIHLAAASATLTSHVRLRWSTDGMQFRNAVGKGNMFPKKIYK